MSPEIPPSAPASQPPSAKRVRRLSRSLAWFFTGLLVMAMLYAVILIVVAVWFPSHMIAGGGEIVVSRSGQNIAGTARLSDLPPIMRTAAAASFIRTAPWLFILWHLRRLFQIHAAGTVFGAGSTAQLRRIALWLVAAAAANCAGGVLLWLGGGAHAPIFNFTQLQTLVSGAIAFAMAQVMNLGHEIEQEKDSFI